MFDHEFCNVTNLEELPEKPTVKIFLVIELVSVSEDEMQASSEVSSDAPSTADTVLISESPQKK